MPSLRIALTGASNLPKMDTFGSCDGYVVLTLYPGQRDQRGILSHAKEGVVIGKTDTVTGANPVWNWKFGDVPLPTVDAMFTFVVMDAEKIGKDKKVGHTSVMCNELQSDKTVTRLHVDTTKAAVDGDGVVLRTSLQVNIIPLDFGIDPTAARIGGKKPASSSVVVPVASGQLEAKKLAAMEHFEDSGTLPMGWRTGNVKLWLHAFFKFDSNKSGTISHKEFRRLLVQHGVDDEELVHYFIQSADENNSGTVEFTEFMTSLRMNQCAAEVAVEIGNLDEEDLKLVVRCVDSDGSGTLSYKEVRRFFKGLGLKVKIADAKGGGGKMNLAQFTELLKAQV